MKTIEAKLVDTQFLLGEFFLLESELKGGTKLNPEGFLAQGLSLRDKYDLTKISEEVSKEVDTLNKFKNDLVASLGKVNEDGSAIIPEFIELEEVEATETKKTPKKAALTKKVSEPKKIGPNPKFIQFHKEFGDFLSTTKHITHKEFKLSMFDDLKTKENFPTLFKLFSDNE